MGHGHAGNHQMSLISKKVHKMQSKQKALQKTRETTKSSKSSTLIPFKEKEEQDCHFLRDPQSRREEKIPENWS